MTGREASVIFVDTETTGLDPDVHELWDIALIEPDGTEHVWKLRPQQLDRASAPALYLNHFYEDEEVKSFATALASRAVAAREIAQLTAGRHLVGAVPSFDAAFLERFLREQNYAPAWHYQPVDVEVLAAGQLYLIPPYDSDRITELLGLQGLDFGRRHTAIADARWAKAVYETVMTRAARAAVEARLSGPPTGD